MTIITFIGAGSVVFTRNLLGDILNLPELANCTIRLHDIDPLRLETAERMAAWMSSALGAHPTIEAYLDRRTALEGASYVLNLVQVGGYAATRLDFDIPRRYGLRQTIADTHGIGGIFRALRTIPFVRELAADMEVVCPGALLINYSNPMSMVCWALFECSLIPVVGLCHSVQGTTRQIAHYTGLPYEEITYLGAGINHISWILRFEHGGQNAYPLLRQAQEAGRIPKTDLVRAELFHRTGYYVTESSEHLAEYLPYFIPHAGLVERYNVLLDEYLRRSEAGLKEFEDTRAKLLRGEAFELKQSAEYASLIIHSMETGQPNLIYGNVRNTGLIENLPHGCCVEVPCLVTRTGLEPVRVGALPLHLAGIIRPHIAVQELAVRAALEGRREYVYQAAMLDPLAAASLPLDSIWEMVDELLNAHALVYLE